MKTQQRWKSQVSFPPLFSKRSILLGELKKPDHTYKERSLEIPSLRPHCYLLRKLDARTQPKNDLSHSSESLRCVFMSHGKQQLVALVIRGKQPATPPPADCQPSLAEQPSSRQVTSGTAPRQSLAAGLPRRRSDRTTTTRVP